MSDAEIISETRMLQAYIHQLARSITERVGQKRPLTYDEQAYLMEEMALASRRLATLHTEVARTLGDSVAVAEDEPDSAAQIVASTRGRFN